MDKGRVGAKPRFALAIHQRVYGPVGLLAVACVTTTVFYFAYDMYLPALPTLTATFGVEESTTNLTLFLYSIFLAIGQILGGSLSDKLGRKPVFLTGMALFTAFSGFCMLATGIWTLICARILQGFGSGIATSAITALITDSYENRSFDRAMTFLQSLPIIGPVVAPFIGSMLLSAINWEAIFGLIAILGVGCLVALALVTETLPRSKRTNVSIGRSISNMARVSKEPGFMAMLIAVSMCALPIFGFMAVCSYIYIEDFGLSYMEYSIIYGAMAALSVIAPLLYLGFSKRVLQRHITWFCIMATIASGILASLFGSISAMAITLSFVPVFIAEGMFRSQGFIVLLENREEMRGAASSAGNFFFSVISSLGTVFATLPWLTYSFGLGVISIACGLISMTLWLYLLKSGHAPSRYIREKQESK